MNAHQGEKVVNVDLETGRGGEQSSRGGQDGGEIEGLIEVEGKYKYAGSEEETCNYSNTANNGTSCLDAGMKG